MTRELYTLILGGSCKYAPKIVSGNNLFEITRHIYMYMIYLYNFIVCCKARGCKVLRLIHIYSVGNQRMCEYNLSNLFK